MTMGSSVTLGLFAALRLAWGRPEGVVLVPDDRKTLVRSFWALPVCLPLVIGSLIQPWLETGITAHAAHSLARESIAFIVSWLLFVEITHRLAPMLGDAKRWGRFITVWNWCNVVGQVLVFTGGLPDMFGAPAIASQASELITLGWALWLEWYVARVVLGVTGFAAAWLVVLDQTIGALLSLLASSLGP